MDTDRPAARSTARVPEGDPAVVRRSDLPRDVVLAGKLTAWEAPGGGEVQMLGLARGLSRLGIRARMWRPWEESLANVDLLHLFGSHPEHLPLIEAAGRHGVPVALSPIAWFDLAGYWAEPRSRLRRLAGCAGLLLRRAFPRVPSWRRKLYHAADQLLPNSQVEADQLRDYFGVPPERIHVVPNGADLRFAAADPEPFVRRVGLRNFVLCPGRIEPRKNQLGLLEALCTTGLPTVILGDPVPGHQAYWERCRRAAGDRAHFLPRLDHEDPLLASAYAAAGCVALAGWYETPGLAALEAGMCGTPLVLPQRGAAAEYFGPLAWYVAFDDPRGIRHAVLAALAQGRSELLAEHVRGNFTWEVAAWAALEAYRKASRLAQDGKKSS